MKQLPMGTERWFSSLRLLTGLLSAPTSTRVSLLIQPHLSGSCKFELPLIPLIPVIGLECSIPVCARPAFGTLLSSRIHMSEFEPKS